MSDTTSTPDQGRYQPRFRLDQSLFLLWAVAFMCLLLSMGAYEVLGWPVVSKIFFGAFFSFLMAALGCLIVMIWRDV